MGKEDYQNVLKGHVESLASFINETAHHRECALFYQQDQQGAGEFQGLPALFEALNAHNSLRKEQVNSNGQAFFIKIFNSLTNNSTSNGCIFVILDVDVLRDIERLLEPILIDSYSESE